MTMPRRFQTIDSASLTHVVGGAAGTDWSALTTTLMMQMLSDRSSPAPAAAQPAAPPPPQPMPCCPPGGCGGAGGKPAGGANIGSIISSIGGIAKMFGGMGGG